MDLPLEARKLIDLHSCEQNALDARYGALAYLLGFSDCVELMGLQKAMLSIRRQNKGYWLISKGIFQ